MAAKEDPTTDGSSGQEWTANDSQVDPSSSQNESPRVSGKLAILFCAISIGIFCGGLDANLVAPAVPEITNAFGSFEDQTWYGTSYYLALSSCQIAWTQVYKAFPAKYVFFGAFLVFQLGSLIAALAPNSAAVIIGRAISGAGISGSFIGGLIIITYIVPLRWRPVMIAFFALVLGSTQTGGPVIGGALTSRLSWRWCFWINLPLGGLSLLLGFFGGNIKDPESRRDGKTTKQLLKDFDIVGFAIWVPFVVCLTLILQFGGLRYTWSSGPLIALYVLTPLLLLMFIFSQRRGGDGALTPGRIMKQRSLACSALYVMSMHAARSQISYFLPIFFQAVQGDSALQSGVNTIPSFLGYVAFQIVASGCMTATGYYTPFMLLGSSISVAGTALLSTLTVSTSSPRWIGYQILAAAGFGFGFSGPQMAAQTVFQDPRDTPVALAIITTCMDLGGSLGVSIGGAILGDRVRQELQSVLPQITREQISNTGITGLQASVPLEQRPLIAQAYGRGLRSVFLASTVLCAATLVFACFVEWRSVKTKQETGKVADEPKVLNDSSKAQESGQLDNK